MDLSAEKNSELRKAARTFNRVVYNYWTELVDWTGLWTDIFLAKNHLCAL